MCLNAISLWYKEEGMIIRKKLNSEIVYTLLANS